MSKSRIGWATGDFAEDHELGNTDRAQLSFGKRVLKRAEWDSIPELAVRCVIWAPWLAFGQLNRSSLTYVLVRLVLELLPSLLRMR